VSLAKIHVLSSLTNGFPVCQRIMASPRRTPQSSQGDIPDIARAIEAMMAAITQQSTIMMQQHEVSMQRQAVSLEQ